MWFGAAEATRLGFVFLCFFSQMLGNRVDSGYFITFPLKIRERLWSLRLQLKTFLTSQYVASVFTYHKMHVSYDDTKQNQKENRCT